MLAPYALSTEMRLKKWNSLPVTTTFILGILDVCVRMFNVYRSFVCMYVCVPLCMSGTEKRASRPMKLELKAAVHQILWK